MGIILLAVILMALLISFTNRELDVNLILPAITVSIIIIFVWIFSKKAIGSYIDAEVSMKITPFQRWWITTAAHFKKPLPGGILFPLIFLLISQGAIKILAILSFDARALPAKAAKKYGLTRRSGLMNEWDYALIAFWSLVAVMALGIVSRTIFSYSPANGLILLSKYSLYFVLWNLLPLGHIDGSRIFFGSKPLYIFSLILAALTFFIVFPVL